MEMPSFYFGWLQKDNPTGEVDRLPELKNRFETSVPGIYCAGDLTGVPLIKLASESGHEFIEMLAADKAFQEQRKKNDDPDVLDLAIIGAGPSGVAAGICAREMGHAFRIVESSRYFNTIENFPKGKPIYVSPAEPPQRSALKFTDGTKETLLEELKAAIEGLDLPVSEGETVKDIVRKDGIFTVNTAKGSHCALRVLVAIGKSGNPRMLGVPGEKLPKVFTRLIDPADHRDQDILVVGGGDSALEAAVALAKEGNRVTLSYRKAELSRPKEQNVRVLEELAERGGITPLFESRVKEISETDVTLETKDGERTIANDAVYALVGTEIPFQFFERSNIRMEGEKKAIDWIMCVALILFSAVLYFGKSAPVTPVDGIGGFFSVPGKLLGMHWTAAVKGLLAWVSFIGMIAAGAVMAVHLARNLGQYFSGAWPAIKYSFYAAMFLLFGYLYLAFNLRGAEPLGWQTWEWYTAFYSVAILVFGLRRMLVRPTGYIIRQTTALILFQWIPLFILPVVVLPWMGSEGMLGPWIMENVFPGESYWRAFGLILAWPLFIFNLASDQPILFWLILSLVQTFAIIPFIVYLWGKGAYCGWVCSCGALAETLGDEYRTKAPHGPRAKKMDNWGQVVLWFAAVASLLIIVKTWFGVHLGPTDFVKELYKIVVDVVFAGVLGVGVYFSMSGRVWCRFLCPLSALMHIYARFSPYRIMANKKRCISCNICTRVCHMGIDVMGFASRGIPMNDVECVRCSACIVNCPMDVLTFGSVGKVDPDNRLYKEQGFPLVAGWKSGLPPDRIGKLLEEEKKKKV